LQHVATPVGHLWAKNSIKSHENGEYTIEFCLINVS